MNDEIDVDVGDGLPIQVELGSPGLLSVDLPAPSPLDVSAVAVGALDVQSQSTPPTAVQSVQTALLAITPELLTPIDIEYLASVVMAASPAQRARLVTPIGVDLWDVTFLGLDNCADGSDGGDTIPFTLGTSYREVGRSDLILKHTFRDRGYIHVMCTVLVTDANPPDTFSYLKFRFRSQQDYDYSPTATAGTRGTAQTPVDLFEFDTGTVSTFAGEKRVTFDVWIKAEGHNGSTWSYGVTGHVRSQTDALAMRADDRAIEGKFTGSFNPKVDQILILDVQTSALTVDQTVIGVSSCATFFHPRGGFGYEV